VRTLRFYGLGWAAHCLRYVVANKNSRDVIVLRNTKLSRQHDRIPCQQRALPDELTPLCFSIPHAMPLIAADASAWLPIMFEVYDKVYRSHVGSTSSICIVPTVAATPRSRRPKFRRIIVPVNYKGRPLTFQYNTIRIVCPVICPDPKRKKRLFWAA
jgi:hypothetical protein